MSENRAERPNMVAQNPYGAPTLPEILPAEDWRPDGAEGEVMVIVPEAFQITEVLKQGGYERVMFPVGTYLVPARIKVLRRIPRDESGEYTSEYRYLEIGGLDEASMHWALKAHKVKHSSNQPIPTGAVPPPGAAAALERFCPLCGHKREEPHARGCPRYVPPADTPYRDIHQETAATPKPRGRPARRG